MDPTLSFGTIETISAADLRVMELMGYDTVPEPSAISVIVLVVHRPVWRVARNRSA